MPPRKRPTTTEPDEAQAATPMMADEIAHVNAPPSEPAGSPTTPSGEQLTAASMAGLLADQKALGQRLDQAEKAWTEMSASMNTISTYFNDRIGSLEAGPRVQPKPAIYAAILGVMNDVQGVGKHGQMDPAARMGNYRYQRYDDLKRELGAAFRTHGVFLQSTTTNMANERIGEGGRMSRVVLSVTYRFTSLVDGSELAFDSHGESIDKSDKATGKAMTMALKTALIQAFMLAAEDIEDPDATRPGEEPPATQQQSRREPHPTQADLEAAQRAMRAGEGPARIIGAARDGYPNDAAKDDGNPWDQGPPKDDRTDEQKAQAAADKVSAPGITMAQWSKISDAARQMGLYEVLVNVNGQQLALKHHLVAVGRTLA